MSTRDALIPWRTTLLLTLVLANAGGQAVGSEPLTVRVVADYARPDAAYDMPDLSRYDIGRLRGETPSVGAGRVSVEPAEGEDLLAEAIRRERGEDLRRRQNGQLRVIAVSDGAVGLQDLVEKLADPEVAHTDGQVVTLRLPVLVRPGAALVVDGLELRLSTDRGAFLINAGALYVFDSRVVGWSEANNAPQRFVDKTSFRPYVASLIHSRTCLAMSHFQSLGYAAPTSYGISLSTQPERLHGEPTQDSPEGVIVGCSFDELYYGFYSYEARDVAIVGNTYTDSIVYGIDPHDRSTRLLIVDNTTIGTRERHGIIGSRGVSHSLIARNTSSGNFGSGIMLDRDCHNIVVADNQVHDNGQGIAVYESPSNRILRNTVTLSKKAALRVRNSTGVVAVDNTFLGSGDYALDISARRLSDHDKRKQRGDTYTQEVELAVFGVRCAGNYGLAKATGLGALQMARIDTSVDPKAAEASRLYSAEQNRRFGSELKPLSSRLAEVFAPSEPLVEVAR